MLACEYFFVSILSFLCFYHSVNGFFSSTHAPVLEETFKTSKIVFASEETNRNRISGHNRLVVDVPKLCKKDELLYPGDNEGDWVCDCKPGFVFHPATDLCYEAYTQGPCRQNEIIHLPEFSSIPECFKNRCPNGKVFFKNNCYLLHDQEGCTEFRKIIGRKVFLVPNPTTLELICADEDFKYECADMCCSGSKRDLCRRQVKVQSTTERVILRRDGTVYRNELSDRYIFSASRPSTP